MASIIFKHLNIKQLLIDESVSYRTLESFSSANWHKVVFWTFCDVYFFESVPWKLIVYKEVISDNKIYCRANLWLPLNRKKNDEYAHLLGRYTIGIIWCAWKCFAEVQSLWTSKISIAVLPCKNAFRLTNIFGATPQFSVCFVLFSPLRCFNRLSVSVLLFLPRFWLIAIFLLHNFVSRYIWINEFHISMIEAIFKFSTFFQIHNFCRAKLKIIANVYTIENCLISSRPWLYVMILLNIVLKSFLIIVN